MWRAENLTISGTGLGNAAISRGALVGMRQWPAFPGTVTLGAASTIGVEQGGTLNLSGVVALGANNLTKLLPGNLTLSGTGANTGTGTTIVNEGSLTANKTAAIAIPGPLTVGNGLGGAGADVVTISGTGGNQIPDTAAAVTVDAGGTLTLTAPNRRYR